VIGNYVTVRVGHADVNVKLLDYDKNIGSSCNKDLYRNTNSLGV